MSRVAYLSILAAALIALAVPPAVQASGFDVIRDCAEDSDLDRKYSNGELKQARDNLPSDLDEYSDCREVINSAITSGSGGSGGGGDGGSGGGGAGGGSGGSGPKAEAARARDEAALDALTNGGGKPALNVAGTRVEPGDNGLFDLASAANGLPLPLLLALIAVLLGAATAGLAALSRRFPGLAERIPLLSKISLPRVPIPGLRR
ncbi:MAG TPA: hypothetical protein VHG69_08650 [Thermoleophilaceae bacterium]|nr:hypothetical protein [Thermoleophilaceae bacterium]